MSEFEPNNGAVMKFQSEKWNQCYLNFYRNHHIHLPDDFLEWLFVNDPWN